MRYSAHKAVLQNSKNKIHMKKKSLECRYDEVEMKKNVVNVISKIFPMNSLENFEAGTQDEKSNSNSAHAYILNRTQLKKKKISLQVITKRCLNFLYHFLVYRIHICNNLTIF